MAVIKIAKNAHWRKEIEKAIDEYYKKDMTPVIYKDLAEWCKSLIRYAVEERLHSIGGHNFTGNLINSIVVILYSKQQKKKEAYYSNTISGKPAIMHEVSALNARGRLRAYDIHFRPGSRFPSPDWSGTFSTLKASSIIPTDESMGFMDAVNFVRMWKPLTGKDFEVCVAYTSEYASFVEAERHTTGFLGTMNYAEYTAVNWIGLK